MAEPVRSVVIDLGGVLETGCWPGIAQAWAPRLGITTRQMLAAVFGGSNDTVLTGQLSEDDWWQQVRRRLGISQTALSGVRADITARWCWDEQLLACLGRVRGRARTAIVSNAWPHARVRLAADGVACLVDDVVLSCETGVAKPDRRIFELALARLGAEPGGALFIDGTPGHVAAAPALGMAGHVHTGTGTTAAAIESLPTRRSGREYSPDRIGSCGTVLPGGQAGLPPAAKVL